MPRVASMTAEQAESEIGRRGNLDFNSMTQVEKLRVRALVRKWLCAKGFKADFCAGVTYTELQHAYNDLAGRGLDQLRKKYDDAKRDMPEMEDSDDDGDSGTVAAPVTVGNPAPTLPAGSDAAALLELLGRLGGRVDPAEIARVVDEKLKDALTAIPTVRIEIAQHDGTIVELDGHNHPNFAKLLKAATTRGSDGYVPGIFLSGEASSGKTTAAKRLAQALSLPFYINGAISQPHEMLGFIDAAGAYHRTPFRDAYENGGVYCFDEVDRSIAGALLPVNPHLANGFAYFPDGPVTRHKDCIIICTGNTWGLGGSGDYSGACKLDAAFLDRFPTKMAWDIDEGLETAISGNPQWASRIQMARARVRASGIKVLISVRSTLAGAALIANGMTPDEVAEITYLANLKPGQRDIVTGRAATTSAIND